MARKIPIPLTRATLSNAIHRSRKHNFLFHCHGKYQSDFLWDIQLADPSLMGDHALLFRAPLFHQRSTSLYAVSYLLRKIVKIFVSLFTQTLKRKNWSQSSFCASPKIQRFGLLQGAKTGQQEASNQICGSLSTLNLLWHPCSYLQTVAHFIGGAKMFF